MNIFKLLKIRDIKVDIAMRSVNNILYGRSIIKGDYINIIFFKCITTKVFCFLFILNIYQGKEQVTYKTAQHHLETLLFFHL